MSATEHAKERKKRIILIALVAAVVIAVVAVGYGVVHASNTKKYHSYFDDGKQYYEIGDYDSAIIYLEKAVSIRSTDESVILLADCYVGKGQTDKAIELLTKYAKHSTAVKKHLERIQNGGTAVGDAVEIAGESYDLETTSVGLSNKGLSSDNLASLAKLVNLKSATLSKNQITTLNMLSGLTNLQVLDISENQITDLTPLAGLSNLRTLYLDGNKIEDFKPLYKLTNLSTLSIKRIDITESKLKELKDALPNCRVHSEKASEDIEDITLGGITFKSNVTQLDLSGKNITDISVLSKCDSLTRLDLRNNHISDLTPLMDLPDLQWLCVKNNRVSDLRPLMGLTRLNYLDLQTNSISSVSSMGYLTSLKNLYLGQNAISSFTALSECADLQELGLENTGLQDGDLAPLKSLKNLKKLYITNNDALSQTAVEALQAALKNCTITHSEFKKEINLGAAKFPAESEIVRASGLGISDISAASGFTKCKTMLLDNNKISNISSLGKLTDLKTLDLSNNKVTDVSSLTTMTGLQSLNLEGNDITDLAPLMTMTWLRELYISGAGLSQEQIGALYSALPGCDVVIDGASQ